MKERINWIDWAKAAAVSSVVFCHLPQSQEWFYYRYLQAVTIVVFIFLSGYLKRDRGSHRANWRKYWQGLIVPYLIYNAAVYPYWIAKYSLQHGGMPNLAEALSPLLGALLLEHENSFCEPLNGPLWYLPAILIMHVTVDLCRRTRYEHHLLTALCVISFIAYAANKYWYFAPNLTPMGLMRNLPYYYMGYVMGQGGAFRGVSAKRDLAACLLCLAASIALFHWHLHAYFSGQHLLHIVLFYPVNVGFLFGVLYGCKLLDGLHCSAVTNLSIGTLVIIGLHIVPITIANRLYGQGAVCYHWYEAAVVTVVIIAALYPLILFAETHAPALIGRQLVIQKK